MASGGLEVLDFDERPRETLGAWIRSIRQHEDITEFLCLVKTGGGGYHVLYRCSKITGNKKIAMPADPNGKPLMESRGEGGYVVAHGSPESVHSSGTAYRRKNGNPFCPPVYTPQQRAVMWRAAVAMDESGKVLKEFQQKQNRHSGPQRVNRRYGSTVEDDFNQRASWSDVLPGWEQVSQTKWRRPGKTSGHSAVTGTASDGTEIITVFSTSAGSLAPSVQGHRSMNKFRAFVETRHRGDRRVAERELSLFGYGGSK